jgi:hypothetical protein
MLFNQKEEWNSVIFRKMDGIGGHHIKRDKSSSERQILHVFTHMQNLDIKNYMTRLQKSDSLECVGGDHWMKRGKRERG